MIRLGNIIDLSIRLRKEKGGWAFGPGVGDGDTSDSVPEEPIKSAISENMAYDTHQGEIVHSTSGKHP